MIFNLAGNPYTIIIGLVSWGLYSFDSFPALPQLAGHIYKAAVPNGFGAGLNLFMGGIQVVMIILMDFFGLAESEIFFNKVKDLLNGLRSAYGVMVFLDYQLFESCFVMRTNKMGVLRIYDVVFLAIDEQSRNRTLTDS
jgi:hypothetical protein